MFLQFNCCCGKYICADSKEVFIDTNQHSPLPVVLFLLIEIGNSFGEGDVWSIESTHLIINVKILLRNFVMLYLGQGCLQ